MTNDLKWAWRMFKRTTFIIGILLTGFALVELINAYSILNNVHPILGLSFILVIVILLIWSVSAFVLAIYRRPRVLIPPEITASDRITESDLRKYFEFIKKFLLRLSENPSLEETEQTQASEACLSLEKKYAVASMAEDRLRIIRETENNVIEPLLKSLDLKADKWIRRCMGEIMVGVTLSPFRAVDLLIVLYRNGVMIMRLVHIYNSRPLLREQLLIFRDTLRTVAAVNYLNFGEKFIEQIFQSVPFIGRMADDITQGVGAGLLTSAAGHAAKYRCRSFHGWDETEAKTHLGKMVTVFLKDVKNIFWKDVFPLLEGRISVMKIKKVKSALDSAFDSTGKVVDSFVIQPTMKIAREGGKIVTRFPKNGIKKLYRRFRNRKGSSGVAE